MLIVLEHLRNQCFSFLQPKNLHQKRTCNIFAASKADILHSKRNMLPPKRNICEHKKEHCIPQNGHKKQLSTIVSN
jgi:hypothetical protein